MALSGFALRLPVGSPAGKEIPSLAGAPYQNELEKERAVRLRQAGEAGDAWAVDHQICESKGVSQTKLSDVFDEIDCIALRPRLCA
ncbi:hypothetical protein Emed_006521 [Eimeria media]